MALNPGDSAPTFTLFDDQTNPFSLSEKTIEHPVVLLFFPGAFTSVCTTEMCTVRDDFRNYQVDGAEVVGISTDSPFALAEFKKANNIPFRLLSDHNAEVSASYGAKFNNDFTPMKLDRISKRAAFVVDRDGTIRYAEVLDNPGNEPDYSAIKKTLASL